MNIRHILQSVVLVIGWLAWDASAAVTLPYDKTSPIIYDNDSQGDVYAENYVIALASAGEIALKGMVVTSIIDAPNTDFSYENAVNFNNAALASAKQSGFLNLPASATRGVKGRLKKPSNGMIDSTAPLWTDGGKLIVAEARKCTYQKPLVVVVGGPSSTVVDAYLQDKTIADKMVMVWINGAGTGYNRLGEDYNGWADNWSLYIAANRLRIVSIPFGGGEVPKWRILSDLPNKPFRTFMYNQTFTTSDGAVFPGGWDGDGSIVDGLVDNSWMLTAKRVSYLDMNASVWSRQIARTYDNPNGNILMITSINFGAQTTAWWKGMSNPKAWAPTVTTPITGAKVAPSLMMSVASDRSSPVSLQGTAPADRIYFFARTDASASRVEFWLDNATPASPSGSPRQTDTYAPFDFNGTASDGKANVFELSTLSAGTHTVSARVTLQDGTVQPVVTGSFTINRTSLYVSRSADRSSSLPLQGFSTASNSNIYVFSGPDTNVARVVFWLDDPNPSNPTGLPVKTENLGPFDFAGTATGGTAYPFSTSSLSVGTHRITIRVTKTDGTTGAPVTASFTRW